VNISSAAAGTSGNNTITTNSLSANQSTSIFAKATDVAGNDSSCTAMTTYLHDGIAPTVSGVSSTAANGTYMVSQTIPVTMTFAETVFVIGAPRLLMETGALDTQANYVSGSGTNTLTFNYVVALNDTSSDLDYQSAAALTLNGGTIKDLAGNSATLTLPAPGTSNSLADQKAIVIQTAAPTIAYTSVSPASPGSSRTPSVTMTLSDASTVTLYSDNGCTSAISTGTALSAGAGQSVTTFTLTANSATQIYAKAVAAYSNTSLCTSLVTYTHDNIAPTATSFIRAAGQNAFTNSVPVNFTLTFSEPINASTFTAGDISNSGTATGVNWTVTDSGDHTVFTIAATSSGNGTLIPRLGVASISDPASNDNGSPHEASQSVSYTAALFTVTVNQAVGQSDPVKTLPISYTVVSQVLWGHRALTSLM
jgi:hypothetical protein